MRTEGSMIEFVGLEVGDWSKFTTTTLASFLMVKKMEFFIEVHLEIIIFFFL